MTEGFDRRLRYVEFALWVGVVTALVVGVSTVVGFALGGSLVRVKEVLFVVGFLLFGVSSLELRPKSPKRDEKQLAPLSSDGENRLEERIQQLPPIDDAHVPYGARVSRGVKMFVVSLLVLAISFSMEAVFGVAVGS